MSGGGGKHRAPIEMPKENSKRKGKKGKGDERFQIDRDTADLRPADGDGSDYRPSMRAAVAHHVITAFLIAMVLGVGTWTYLAFKGADVTKSGEALRAPIFEKAAGDAQMDRFVFALEVYFRIYEKYPPDLDALVDEGLLSGRDLNYPRGSSTIIYERTGDSYQLTMERTVVQTAAEDTGLEPGPDAGAPQTNGGDTP